MKEGNISSVLDVEDMVECMVRSSAGDIAADTQLTEAEIQSTIKLHHETSQGGVERSTVEGQCEQWRLAGALISKVSKPLACETLPGKSPGGGWACL
jgi:hypothetical protein